jgi:pimeloyl-ACP methyl ester carboxylesterase
MLICIPAVTRTPHDWKPGQEQIPPPRTGEVPTIPPIISNEKQAEDCAALVKALKLPPVHIVANGVNTAICYYLLINYPDLCKSAILLSPASLVEVSSDLVI